MPTVKDYKIVLTTDSAVSFHILGLILCIVGFFLHVHVLCVIGFVFAYTGFDILGFKWALHHKYGIRSLLAHVPEEISSAYVKDHLNPATAGYRLMQHPYAIFVSILAIPLVGWMPVFMFWLLWVTGLCDVLYYVGVFMKLPDVWTWVSWILPFGAIFRLFGKGLPNWVMIANVFLGIIVAIIVQFL